MSRSRFAALVPVNPERRTSNALKYDPEAHPQMVRDLGQKGMFPEEWCAHIGITMSTLYKWADDHPEFEDACHIAWYLLRAYWAKVARNAAQGGAGVVSPTVLALILTRRFPDTYGSNPRNTQEVFARRNDPEPEHAGAIPGEVNPASQLDDEDLARRIAELQQRQKLRQAE